MRTLLAAVLVLAFSTIVMAKELKDPSLGTGSNPKTHLNKGYINNTGKYIQPHIQTNPNKTQSDNFNKKGNYDPYTGKTGTR